MFAGFFKQIYAEQEHCPCPCPYNLSKKCEYKSRKPTWKEPPHIPDDQSDLRFKKTLHQKVTYSSHLL